MRFILLFLLAPSILSAQFFSGEIIYKVKITPDMVRDSLPINLQINQEDSIRYMLQGNQYKSTHYKNGNFLLSYTYDPESERIYDEHVENDFTSFRDVTKEKAAFQKLNVFRDSTCYILGLPCFLTKTDTGFNSSKTYYSDILKVNTDLYVNHNLEHWNKMLKAVDGAIPLKIISTYENLTITREAVRIVIREIAPNEFDWNKKLPLYADMQALDVQVKMKELSEDQISCFREITQSNQEKNPAPVRRYARLLIKKTGDIASVNPILNANDQYTQMVMDFFDACKPQFTPEQHAGAPVDAVHIIYFDF